MVAEVFAGLSALKSAFDIAKGLKDIDDATRRNSAVIELQETILSAQAAQSELVESVRALKAEVASFETWDAEKERYELQPLGSQAIFAYSLKAGMGATEPPHSICPDCYQQRRKSILQQATRFPGRCDVRLCQRCGWEAYLSGGWHQEHGKGRGGNERAR